MSTKKQAKIICFSNHKGGVGKSCSTCNVGAGIGRQGKKVLLVDLDPQANLSVSLGAKDAFQSIYNVLRGELPISNTIINVTENLDLVPSCLDLAGAEIELTSEAGRDLILKEALSEIECKYDYIFIDCPPSIGLLTINALTASKKVYIPLQAEYLSLQGVSKLTSIIEKLKQRLDKNLSIGGVLITLFDSRKILNRDISEAIEEHFEKKVFKTRIRNNVSLAEAPGMGKDIFRYNLKSNGARDYLALCKEILDREEQEEGFYV